MFVADNGVLWLVAVVCFALPSNFKSLKYARRCRKSFFFEYLSQNIARFSTKLGAALVNKNQLIAEQGKVI